MQIYCEYIVDTNFMATIGIGNFFRGSILLFIRSLRTAYGYIEWYSAVHLRNNTEAR